MKIPEILIKLKTLKTEIFDLQMSKNTITPAEFVKKTDLIERMVNSLIRELEGE